MILTPFLMCERSETLDVDALHHYSFRSLVRQSLAYVSPNSALIDSNKKLIRFYVLFLIKISRNVDSYDQF